jgi:hypothetical protein
MESTLVNKVVNSGLFTIDLEKFYPEGDFVYFDIKEIDWAVYKDKNLLIVCSVDAILPLWSFMLVAAYAAPYAKAIFQGDKDTFLSAHYDKVISQWKREDYADKKMVLKGCSEKAVPASAYTAAVQFLQPVASSIFFGEPCSTVPIYKKAKDI